MGARKMAVCRVCAHPERETIENYLSTYDYGNASMTLEDIAERFEGVTVEDLQVHACMHSTVTKLEDEGNSIVGSIQKREANKLEQVIEEYFVTLKEAGRAIRAEVNCEYRGKGMSKELVEAYLGAGREIRQATATLIEMNTRLNEGNDGAGAFVDVIKAIRGTPSTVGDEDDTD